MPTLADAVGSALAENLAQRNAMMAAIASREAIAFIGAGLSVPLGYPSWDTLLNELAAQAHARR